MFASHSLCVCECLELLCLSQRLVLSLGYVQYVQWQYVQICYFAVNVKSVEGTFTHSFGHFYQLLCQSVISISLIYHCIILKKTKIKLSIHHLCRSFTMITITIYFSKKPIKHLLYNICFSTVFLRTATVSTST